jgi:hypothetical protein
MVTWSHCGHMQSPEYIYHTEGLEHCINQMSSIVTMEHIHIFRDKSICNFSADINECSSNQHTCHRDAKCINTSPGYQCHCKPGYKTFNYGRLCEGIVVFVYFALLLLHVFTNVAF